MESRVQMNMREAQAAETRRKLLESAQKLFAEKGYKGTPVREINRSVNLADGLLYHYFPGGKKEIFQVVIKENMQQILMALAEKNSVKMYLSMPLEEVLESAYRNYTEVIEQHIDIIHILFRENEVREFVTKEQLLQLTGKKSFWLQTLLEKKCELGEVREMDFESAALTITAILMNHVMAKIFNIGSAMLDNSEYRKRIIAYQVAMWKNSQP